MIRAAFVVWTVLTFLLGFGLAKAFAQDIPIRLINVGYKPSDSKLPIVEVRFADLDKPSSLIIDTGSTLSSLDDETFEALTELGSIMPIGFASTKLGDGSKNVVDLYRVLTDISIGDCIYPADIGIGWLYSKGGMGVVGQNILQTMAVLGFNNQKQRFVFVCPF